MVRQADAVAGVDAAGVSQICEIQLKANVIWRESSLMQARTMNEGRDGAQILRWSSGPGRLGPSF
jgi:hypothetical protein